ncbi:MAG: transcription-repair coupling factor, partial [Holosporales bacterium]|nr:transcription-repair coupling factor [Holosporales bacterium]
QESQLSNKNLESATIVKCSEIVLNENSKYHFREKFNFPNEHSKESVENGNFFPGIEWYLQYFHEKIITLLDYLPSNTLLIFDCEVKKYNSLFFSNAERRFKELKDVPPVLDIFSDSIFRAKKNFKVLEAGLINENSIFQNHEKTYNIRKKSDLDEIISKLEKKTIFSLKSNGGLNILLEILKNEEINLIKSFFEAKKGKINLIISGLKQGFFSKDLIVYTELELFGSELKFIKRRNSKNVIHDYSKLSPGDYVVHEKHGVAIFEGLFNIDVSGILRDFLSLKYMNNDKLYVPIENIALVSRYGNSDSNIQLDSLKSSSWSNREKNVRKKILVIANDLLKLAAERKLNKVASLSIPENYDLFCKGFDHIETDDQLCAINDVLEDLKNDIPMDRLICGDVGFGKTEVALRAAFVVSSALKQVVLLAPTTILAAQHYKSFLKRFSKFGIETCQLSSFTPRKQIEKIIGDIASGKMQIIIATHSILLERIKFADLGLVIIDEEQHFGVKQKESLKRRHVKTHFMTLSATPIPRTLQLAISGIRDLSTITTPPLDRLPIKTIVCDFEKSMIKAAIEQEVKIGGQVFFVTPRIEFLEGLYRLVSKIVPELRVKQIFGKAKDIEESIRDFCDFKIDVLISTNIIDSGIDIPNANTILIHRFDLFGLSQLYQLRGRVGRSRRQAYAYLLLENDKVLTKHAKKRLEVLNNLNKLGAGITLASYDLDIRGAGNLIGEEQSGYIKEVGLELYQAMLREAILMLKSESNTTKIGKREVQINLGAPLFIPESYIEDSGLRLEIYRKIGTVENASEVDAMEYELSDRFGIIPFETKNLLTLVRIKMNCLSSNIEKFDVGSFGLVFSFFDNKCENIKGLQNFLKSYTATEGEGGVKICPDQRIVIKRKWKDMESRTRSVYEISNILVTFLRCSS